MSGDPIRIRVVCNDPGHAPRVVPVDNFVRLASGEWHEVPPSRAGERAGSGYHLLGNDLAESGWALDGDVGSGSLRDKYRLECRKCKGRPKGQRQEALELRRETLFGKLDDWCASGAADLPLAALAASIERSKPERGQG